MRTIDVNTVNVVYPNSTVWIGDNITISLSHNLYTVGAKIYITNISTLKTKELVYISELKNLSFDISDTVRKLFVSGGSDINVKVLVYTDGFYEGTFGFNMNVLDGKTLPQRKHGSTRTIYVYGQDDLYKTQIVFAGTGKLTINGNTIPVTGTGRNSFDLRSYITHSGEYWLCYKYGAKAKPDKDETLRIEITNVDESVRSAIVFLDYHSSDTQPVVDEIDGGDIWSDSKVNLADFCIRIIYQDPCDDFNFWKVRYFDTDGCMRYLGGKIDSETLESKQKNYYYSDNSVYKNLSRKHIEEASNTVKVNYPDLMRDSYWQDILLADRIDFLDYSNTWKQCSIATNKVTVNSDDSMDVQLEFEILKY